MNNSGDFYFRVEPRYSEKWITTGFVLISDSNLHLFPPSLVEFCIWLQVLGPSLITMLYTYWYIFLMMRRLRSGVPIHDKEYATALAENLSNPSHIMSFVLIVVFWLSWTPYTSVRLYEYFTASKLNVGLIYQCCCWIGNNKKMSVADSTCSIRYGVVRGGEFGMEVHHSHLHEPAISFLS